MEFIMVLFVFLVGLFRLLFPEMAWELEHIFTVQGGGPTDFYLITTRISGGLCIVVALVCGGLLLFA